MSCSLLRALIARLVSAIVLAVLVSNAACRAVSAIGVACNVSKDCPAGQVCAVDGGCRSGREPESDAESVVTDDRATGASAQSPRERVARGGASPPGSSAPTANADGCDMLQCANGVCRSERGRSFCDCAQTKFSGPLCDVPQDANTCAANNGGCEQHCTEQKNGSPLCTCDEGALLKADGKGCWNWREPVVYTVIERTAGQNRPWSTWQLMTLTAEGKAFVVTEVKNVDLVPGQSHLMNLVFDRASGWSGLTELAVDQDKLMRCMRQTLTPQGDAMLVQGFKEGSLRVFRYDALSGWGAATNLTSMAASDGIFMPEFDLSGMCDVWLDENGAALVAAVQAERVENDYNVDSAVYASQSDGTGAWTPLALIESAGVEETPDKSDYITQLSMVRGAAGDLRGLVWAKGTVYGTGFKPFRPAQGWEMGTSLSTGGSTKLATNVRGESWTISVLPGADSGPGPIAARHYSESGAWEPEVPLDSDAIGLRVEIAVSDSGDVVAAWIHRQPDRSQVVRARAFSPNKGWSEPVQVSDPAVTISELALDVDDQGNAMVLWVQWVDEMQSLWSHRFSIDHGWLGPTMLRDKHGWVLYVRAAMDADGRTIATWVESDLPTGELTLVGSAFE